MFQSHQYVEVQAVAALCLAARNFSMVLFSVCIPTFPVKLCYCTFLCCQNKSQWTARISSGLLYNSAPEMHCCKAYANVDVVKLSICKRRYNTSQFKLDLHSRWLSVHWLVQVKQCMVVVRLRTFTIVAHADLIDKQCKHITHTQMSSPGIGFLFLHHRVLRHHYIWSCNSFCHGVPSDQPSFSCL